MFSGLQHVDNLDMSEVYAHPQIESEHLIFQQDGAPPYYVRLLIVSLRMRNVLKVGLEAHLNLPHLHFYLWGFYITMLGLLFCLKHTITVKRLKH